MDGCVSFFIFFISIQAGSALIPKCLGQNFIKLPLHVSGIQIERTAFPKCQPESASLIYSYVPWKVTIRLFLV